MELYIYTYIYISINIYIWHWYNNSTVCHDSHLFTVLTAFQTIVKSSKSSFTSLCAVHTWWDSPSRSFPWLISWVLEKVLQPDPSPVHTLTCLKPPSQSILWKAGMARCSGEPGFSWCKAAHFPSGAGHTCFLLRRFLLVQMWLINDPARASRTEVLWEDLHSMLPATLSPKGFFYDSKHNLCTTRAGLGHKQISAILVCRASCPSTALAVLLQLHFWALCWTPTHNPALDCPMLRPPPLPQPVLVVPTGIKHSGWEPTRGNPWSRSRFSVVAAGGSLKSS